MFQRDIAFQKEHTRYPLRYTFLDANADPEPKTIKRNLTKVQAEREKGVRYPSMEIEKTNALERRVTKTKASGYVVRFDKPDSDVYSMEFQFLNVGGCWQLAAVNDISL